MKSIGSDEKLTLRAPYRHVRKRREHDDRAGENVAEERANPSYAPPPPTTPQTPRPPSSATASTRLMWCSRTSIRAPCSPRWSRPCTTARPSASSPRAVARPPIALPFRGRSHHGGFHPGLHPDLPLRLVPVGLNYFSGHRFARASSSTSGSHSLCRPSCSRSTSQAASSGGDDCYGAHQLGALGVTVSAPDDETLEFFWTLRRLVRTSHGPMSLDEQTELARRFSLGYERIMPDGRKWKDTERVQRVMELTSHYNARLKSLGLRDYQVAHVMAHLSRFNAAALRRLLLLALFLWLPMSLCGRFSSSSLASSCAQGAAGGGGVQRQDPR